jgi:Uma2 family endonuclease
MEAKLLLSKWESERHPDILIYKTPPPDIPDSEVWSVWIPDIVVEVVSPGSERRDYIEKRAEYLDVGAKEYWILDPQKDQALILRRSRGAWAERMLKPSSRYKTPLLPGFELHCASVFQSARKRNR